ncbi:hypothetical protein BRADI_3g41825v3 [Brachypodium distachyon]|uniref:Uncharacterized protein n=1 Tax=Brachypodium distachyon TaxID=15368 RepID=A0A0Q3JLI9_BRADI|nr:hypothetical protein BRADI_3g41825v3 [Brachypodium distachyon]
MEKDKIVIAIHGTWSRPHLVVWTRGIIDQALYQKKRRSPVSPKSSAGSSPPPTNPPPAQPHLSSRGEGSGSAQPVVRELPSPR